MMMINISLIAGKCLDVDRTLLTLMPDHVVKSSDQDGHVSDGLCR